jgi:roundabout axon guidance receptor 2
MMKMRFLRCFSVFFAVIRDEFREEPANVQSSVGDIAILPCKPPRGDPEPRVRWKKNGELMPLMTAAGSSADGIDGRRISMLDDGSLQIRDLRREDEGYYVCTAQNTAGSRDSRPAQLSVYGRSLVTI